MYLIAGQDNPASPSNHGPQSSTMSSTTDIDLKPVSTLDSFIPILRHLPGLYLDNNLYYIRGSIAIDDWARLRDRTLTVSKFILTDVREKNFEAHISPAAYFRLALSKEPGIPLSPHLSDLIIVDADASLSYLEILLTPSLTSLEVSRIPNAKQPTLFSFLTTLAQVAPLLQTLTFGPGFFPSKSIVQTVLQFKNLRQLELKDAVPKMTFAFLESLASSSPALESLILDARSCEYIPSTAIMSKGLSKGIEDHTPRASFGTNLELMDGKNDEESPQSNTSDVGDAFSQLMKLHIIGSPLFLGDLILQIASTRLEDISITVVTGMEIVNTSKKRKAEKKREKRKSEVEARGLSVMSEIWLGELAGESMEERRMKSINEQQKANNIFSALLQLLPSRWSSLKTISVVNDHSPLQALIAPTLLNETFRPLLFHPTIENLIVKGWTLDSVEDTILGLAELTPSNLKSLVLPANSGLSWSTL